MATPAEMRALAATLEEIAPHVDTDYGPGQVATYGLSWEALRSGADEIERLRETGYALAMLGLQSVRYPNDPEFREAVDKVLALTIPRPKSSVINTGDDDADAD